MGLYLLAGLRLLWVGLLALLYPGAGELALGRVKRFVFFSLAFFVWFIAFFKFRFYSNTAVIWLLAALVLIFSVSFISVICSIKYKKTSKHYLFLLGATLWTILWSVGVGCAVKNKIHWLGFEIYFIRSNSMLPTIKPGELLVANTWVKANSLSHGDIVFFNDHSQGGQVLHLTYHQRGRSKLCIS